VHNLLDLPDDDLWNLEANWHSAGHLLALLVTDRVLTPDSLDASPSLERDSAARPFVAAFGLLVPAVAYGLDIARANGSNSLDHAMLLDHANYIHYESATCPFRSHPDWESDDAEVDDEGEEGGETFDDVGLTLLRDEEWLDAQCAQLDGRAWDALTRLVERWQNGARPTVDEEGAILAEARPHSWTTGGGLHRPRG
jgi:hypothetical protein